MTYEQFKKRAEDFGGFTEHTFFNEHKEEYKLIFTGFTILITGDELDWEVVNMFNSDFNIFSKEELIKIGAFLVKL